MHVVIRPNSNLKQLDPVVNQIELHVYDGAIDGLQGIVSTGKPEVVFHLASMAMGDHTSRDVRPMLEANVVFGTQLLDAMAGNGITNFVNTGTFWQHYRNQEYNPVCLYAASKEAFEAVIRFYVEATEMQAITLELHDTYGPGDPRPKLFNLLREAALSGKPVSMTAGEQMVDLIYIDDVVQAYVTAGCRLLAGTAQGHSKYAVRSGTETGLREIVQLVNSAYGSPVPVLWGEKPYRNREMMRAWTGGERLPGWKSQIPLQEGIKRLVNSWR